MIITRSQTQRCHQKNRPYWLICVKDHCRFANAGGFFDPAKVFLPHASDQICFLYRFAIPETCMNGGRLENDMNFFICDSEHNVQRIIHHMYPGSFTVQKCNGMMELARVDTEIRAVLNDYLTESDQLELDVI